mgnify:CR=1 FL=1
MSVMIIAVFLRIHICFYCISIAIDLCYRDYYNDYSFSFPGISSNASIRLDRHTMVTNHSHYSLFYFQHYLVVNCLSQKSIYPV